MEFIKRFGAFILAAAMLISGGLEKLFKLNTDKETNSVRQGIVSERMGISRARAEEVESLEEFVEKDVIKGNRPAVERYPGTHYIEINEEKKEILFNRLNENFNKYPYYIFEKTLVNEETDEEFTLQMIGEMKTYKALMEENESNWSIKGSYQFMPEDLINCVTFKSGDRVIVLNAVDNSTSIGLEDIAYDNFLFVDFYENGMTPEERADFHRQIFNGLVVYDNFVVKENEVANNLIEEFNDKYGPGMGK